jgi:hypothetical protein
MDENAGLGRKGYTGYERIVDMQFILRRAKLKVMKK